MAPRKTKVKKLDVLDGNETPGSTEAGISLVEEHPADAIGKPDRNKSWHAAASKLLDTIRRANASVDDRREIPVTVIIPALLRNEQDVNWLLEAFESVDQQTVFVQCIIVENGSEMLADLSGKTSIIHSEKGLSIARNAGIRASETEYFFPLDANDWLPDDAIETIYDKRADKGFTYGSTMLFANARGIGDQHLYNAKPYDFQEVMKMVYFPNGALQKRSDWELIGGYRENLTILEDWDYWITAGEKGICGTAIQDVIYWYRQHGGMVMTNNHTPEWENTKKLIQTYHADVYKGVHPPMCCGNKTQARSNGTFQPVQLLSAPGAEGMMLIEYTGGNVGKMPYYGAVTKTRYEVSGIQKRLYIDVRDAATGSKTNPGFLEIADHGVPQFKQVPAE